MAIKIDLSGNITKVSPGSNKYFNVSSLESAVGGWPDPTKVGPLWVIRNENAEEELENVNSVASIFFDTPIYGEVVAMSAHELPPEWDLLDEFDIGYTPEQIDAGFIKAVHEKVPTVTMKDYDSKDISDDVNTYETIPGMISKNEYVYKPEKALRATTPTEDHDKFLADSYDFIIQSYEDNFKDFVLYEDIDNIVRVEGDESRKIVIDQLLALFIEREEYERCAVLRDIIDKYYS